MTGLSGKSACRGAVLKSRCTLLRGIRTNGQQSTRRLRILCGTPRDSIELLGVLVIFIRMDIIQHELRQSDVPNTVHGVMTSRCLFIQGHRNILITRQLRKLATACKHSPQHAEIYTTNKLTERTSTWSRLNRLKTKWEDGLKCLYKANTERSADCTTSYANVKEIGTTKLRRTPIPYFPEYDAHYFLPRTSRISHPHTFNSIRYFFKSCLLHLETIHGCPTVLILRT